MPSSDPGRCPGSNTADARTRHAGGAGTGVLRRAGRESAFALAPAAGPVGRDDGPDHGAQSRRAEGLALADGGTATACFPGWHESGTARRRYPRRSRRWPGPARRASRRNRQRAAAHAGPGGRSRTSPGLAWPRRKKRRPSQQNQLGLRCGRPSRLPDMLVHAAADERTRSGSDDSVPAGTPSAFAARVPAETLTAVTSATGPDVSSRTARSAAEADIHPRNSDA